MLKRELENENNELKELATLQKERIAALEQRNLAVGQYAQRLKTVVVGQALDRYPEGSLK